VRRSGDICVAAGGGIGVGFTAAVRYTGVTVTWVLADSIRIAGATPKRQ
jgi:hypothetical protein